MEGKGSHNLETDKDKTNENSSQYFVLMLKERDAKILRMKQKIANFKQQLNQKKHNDGDLEDEVLQKINYLSENKFSTINECVEHLQKSKENLQQYPKRIDSSDSKGSYSSDKQILYNKEAEDLNDEIYNLEYQMKSQEKKFKSKLKDKEVEIEELQEEINAMKSTKSNDKKNKTEIKRLKETIEELETEMQSQSDEIKSKNKKMKELIIEVNEKQSIIDQSNKAAEECTLLKNEIQSLKNDLEKKGKEYENKVEELNNNIARKQKAMDTMKSKIDNNRTVEEDQKTLINKLKVECEKYEKDLENERRNSVGLNKKIDEQHNRIEFFERKINQLEKEIHDSRALQFKKKDNEVQSVMKNKPNILPKPAEALKKGEVTENPKNEKVCPNCRTIFSADELNDHISKCMES